MHIVTFCGASIVQSHDPARCTLVWGICCLLQTIKNRKAMCLNACLHVNENATCRFRNKNRYILSIFIARNSSGSGQVLILGLYIANYWWLLFVAHWFMFSSEYYFGSKREEVTSLEKLCNARLHDLNSANIIGDAVMSLRFAVLRMDGMDEVWVRKYWSENLNGRYHFGDLKLGGKIILKWT